MEWGPWGIGVLLFQSCQKHSRGSSKNNRVLEEPRLYEQFAADSAKPAMLEAREKWMRDHLSQIDDSLQEGLEKGREEGSPTNRNFRRLGPNIGTLRRESSCGLFTGFLAPCTIFDPRDLKPLQMPNHSTTPLRIFLHRPPLPGFCYRLFCMKRMGGSIILTYLDLKGKRWYSCMKRMGGSIILTP